MQQNNDHSATVSPQAFQQHMLARRCDNYKTSWISTLKEKRYIYLQLVLMAATDNVILGLMCDQP